MRAPIQPDVAREVVHLIADKNAAGSVQDFEGTTLRDQPRKAQGSAGFDRGIIQVALHTADLSRRELRLVFLPGLGPHGLLGQRHGRLDAALRITKKAVGTVPVLGPDSG